MDNMQNMNEGKSRKKLLVPLVVLLLCAVSLTGAAYAYTSTLTNTGNTAEVHYLSVDKSIAEDAELMVDGTKTIAAFTDNYEYNGNSPVKNVIKCDFESPVTIATYNLNVQRDGSDAVYFTVSSSDLANKVLYGTTKITEVFDVKYKIGAASYALGVTASNVVAVNANFTVEIVFEKKATIEDPKIIDTVTDFSGDFNTAQKCYDLFDNGNNKFTLTFEANTVNPNA